MQGCRLRNCNFGYRVEGVRGDKVETKPQATEMAAQGKEAS
jgi:hypothetical protein